MRLNFHLPFSEYVVFAFNNAISKGKNPISSFLPQETNLSQSILLTLSSLVYYPSLLIIFKAMQMKSKPETTSRKMCLFANVILSKTINRPQREDMQKIFRKRTNNAIDHQHIDNKKTSKYRLHA